MLEPMAQAFHGASNAAAPAIPQAQPNTTPIVAPFIPVSKLKCSCFYRLFVFEGHPGWNISAFYPVISKLTLSIDSRSSIGLVAYFDSH
jgi:hypothetical protein